MNVYLGWPGVVPSVRPRGGRPALAIWTVIPVTSRGSALCHAQEREADNVMNCSISFDFRTVSWIPFVIEQDQAIIVVRYAKEDRPQSSAYHTPISNGGFQCPAGWERSCQAT